MSSARIAKFIQEARRFVDNGKDSLFSRGAHHNKSKDLLLKYVACVEILVIEGEKIAESNSAESRHRMYRRALREVEEILRRTSLDTEQEETL